MSFSIPSKILVFMLSCLLSVSAWASDFDNGVKEAKAKNWPGAEQAFRASIQQNPLDANAFYNLGTSLAAQQKFPEAIWALEKSYKLNPKLKEARNNLQYCYNQAGIQETWEPALSYLQDKAYQFGINSWTYISITLVLLLSGFIFIGIAAKKMNLRRMSIVFAVFMAIFLFFSLRNALNAYDFKYNDTHVVLVQDETSVFHDDKGNMRFDLSLKGGSRYKIAEISNGRVGLLMKNQMVVWIDQKNVWMF